MARGSRPGERRGGRKKGTPNKLTADAREALQQAFEGIGGVQALTAWAEQTPTEFYKLWGRTIPQHAKIEHEGAIQHGIVILPAVQS